MNKIKTLTRESMQANINGLSLGDKAYCGPYGVVTCRSSKKYNGKRTFSIAGSTKLRNGGNWTMSAIRKAICD